jgi:hypothetical protein
VPPPPGAQKNPPPPNKARMKINEIGVSKLRRQVKRLQVIHSKHED